MYNLELSKVLMYEFHYDYIKSKYGNISRQLFPDTDILMYEIKTEDVYEDFSNYNPRQNICKKVEKPSKPGQGKKSLISTFGYSLTGAAKV